MKNFIASIIISIVAVLNVVFSNEDNSKIETPKIEFNWQVANLYDISIEDGVYMFNGCECLPNNSIIDAINKIKSTDNVSYPYDIEIIVKYIPEEGLYIANLFDSLTDGV